MVAVELTDFPALSFDCYGTLIDWETGIGSRLADWARVHRLDVSAEDLLTSYARHEAAAMRDTPAARYPDILARSFTAVGRDFATPADPEEATAFGRSVPDWPAFPDSAEALRALAERYRLIILSNVDRESFAGSNARLGVRFDHVLTAEDIGSYKPDPRNFTALLGLGGPEPLHVAQSLFHDHVPAARAGLSTAWINRRKGKPGWGATPPPEVVVSPDWEFASMAEFAEAAV